MLIADRQIKGIGLGTAQFAFRDGTAEESVATVHAALDTGVRLIDTALAYTRSGVESYAEQVVARALRGSTADHPHRLVPSAALCARPSPRTVAVNAATLAASGGYEKCLPSDRAALLSTSARTPVSWPNPALA